MPLSQLSAIALFLLLIGIALWYLFFKKKKRITAAFPENWRAILNQKVDFYRQLEAAEKVRFEQSVQILLDDIRITGVGTEVDDTDRMLVAASGVILLFGFTGWHYRNLNEVLLYEGAFNQDYETRRGEERNILGMVGGTGMNRTMILSKPSLHRGFEDRNSQHNVGIHEFAHLLDRADGATDGIPEGLLQKPFLMPWLELMHGEIKAIREGNSDIDEYGSTNEAEFFSVVSEYFFKQPDLLEKRHPELFAMLKNMFSQDLS